MSDDIHFRLGEMAVRAGLVDQAALDRCLAIQAAEGARQLGEILVDEGVIELSEVHRLVIEQMEVLLGASDVDVEIDPASALFGDRVVAEGLATRAQVDRCLEEQAHLVKFHLVIRLGEILINNGFLTADQVRRVLAQQDKQILACPQCGVRYNVVDLEADDVVKCAPCQVALVPPEGVEVKETLHLRRDDVSERRGE